MSDAGAAHGGDTADLASGYAMLARCWRQPTADLVDAVADSGLFRSVGVSIEDVSVTALRAEHARLFVGPGEPRCPPYESVYRNESADVLGPAAHDVVQWYQEYDLGLDPDWPDLPDHVATELEFAAYLLARGETTACESFLDEHPEQWLDEFLADVKGETEEPFYEALAEVTAASLE
ncbi:molecular chaperone [Natronoarchaeum sp. GCM10025703]|uniref:TorD/DmsD family molecular chaperone n=1 Tax=unclassified Natronoarchaeum TaxID=2620183 RepID=UPI00360E0534